MNEENEPFESPKIINNNYLDFNLVKGMSIGTSF